MKYHKSMNVYDLDETILEGDSEHYFFKYCFDNLKLSRKARFKFKFYGFLRSFFKISFNYTRPRQYYFLREIENIDQVLKDFWDIHFKYVKKFFIEQHKEDDIISTASPLFLEEELIKRLNIKHIYATDMDKHTGKITNKINIGAEKVKNLQKHINLDDIDEFYSDSLSDTPLAKVAKHAYLVTGNKIEDWPK